MPPGLSVDFTTPIATASNLADRTTLDKQLDDTADVTSIALDGDVILNIGHQRQTQKFRVRVASLRVKSKYFARLLEPNRFGEGSQVEQQLQVLRNEYPNFTDVPVAELPLVNVIDLGRISPVKSIGPLCADFLHILHDHDLGITPAPPVVNLANLAIVADRFDALDAVRAYINKKKYLRMIETRTTPKIDSALSEDKLRQRLLVPLFFGYTSWIEKYSFKLISRGSVSDTTTTSTNNNNKNFDMHDITSRPLWYDLPYRIEDELSFRRAQILSTIDSIQSYFLQLYTSRERQCKLGYDSSAQCDSFQLGEMIKFFRRVNTLKLQGTLIGALSWDSYDHNSNEQGYEEGDEDDYKSYQGDLHSLLESLRQVPEYQIDRNHSHCGLRTRLVPLLDLVLDGLQGVGVCGTCWSENRAEYVWMDAKRVVLWRRGNGLGRSQGHAARHEAVRNMFMATSRDWS